MKKEKCDSCQEAILKQEVNLMSDKELKYALELATARFHILLHEWESRQDKVVKIVGRERNEK